MSTAVTLPDGSIFVANKRHVPETPAFGSFTGPEAEEKLAAWAREKWATLFMLKQGEAERLKTCELFYAGFHYEDPWDNENNPITNYCAATVETIWPILTEVKPRPVPVPRRWMDADRVRRIADFATYKMDTCGFDSWFELEVRDLLKYGWIPPFIGWNAHGTSVPRYLHPLDFYHDGAPDESEMEMFAIARPVATRRLRAAFPDVEIQPDNIASPSYEVLEHPYLNGGRAGGKFPLPQMIGPMPSTVMEGATATTSGNYAMDTGVFRTYGQTTFLIQLFVRDYTTMGVRYVGERTKKHPAGPLRIPHSEIRQEPCCASGWRMIPLLATGKLLDKPRPVDLALGGIPCVIGRNYAQGGRFFAPGELDWIIPIQRDINRSDALISRSLELQANPPVLASLDSRLSVDRSGIDGGEILRIARGSKVEYLQPQSPSEAHFERRALRRMDIQIVGGTPDSLAGQRPVGIEAGTAIRQLNDQATTRARAKGPSLLRWAALMLQKCMRADARKSREMIYYKGQDGRDMWMDPRDLTPEDWDIRWAQESGSAQGRQDRRDLNLQLHERGIIDGQQVLEDEDYPNRGRILMRQALAAQAAPQTNGGGSER